MSVEYCGCFHLIERVGQSSALKTFLNRIKVNFLASCWTCEFDSEVGGLKNELTSHRNESSYFRDCWENEIDLNAEFGNDDFVITIGIFHFHGIRYARLRITERHLMSFVRHLKEQKSDFLLFISELETTLTSSACVIGEDTSTYFLLNFLTEKATLNEIKEIVRFASHPSPKNVQMLRLLGFKESNSGQINYFFMISPIFLNRI